MAGGQTLPRASQEAAVREEGGWEKALCGSPFFLENQPLPTLLLLGPNKNTRSL